MGDEGDCTDDASNCAGGEVLRAVELDARAPCCAGSFYLGSLCTHLGADMGG